jgi:N-acetylglucosaminyl-diphospho-decaprenol L-rhamnosyltransferase
MDLGIVIVNWNVRALLAACLDSVYLDLAQSAAHLRGTVCVVDNGSHDGSLEMLRKQFPRTMVLSASNRGMGAGNNLGMRTLIQHHNPFALLVLNPDTLIRPGALRHLTAWLRARPRAGVAGPKLLNPDGSLQHSGFRFPGLTQAALDLITLPSRLSGLVNSPLNGRYASSTYQAGVPFRVDHTLGAAFAVRADAIAECGMFDETYHMYCEEIDWQWRLARAGWERWIVPAAEVVHLGGQSTRQVRAQALAHLWTSRRRLYYRHHSAVLNALTGPLVQFGLRQRIRANHRLSQRGTLPADERAAINLALSQAVQAWQGRRPPRVEVPELPPLD